MCVGKYVTHAWREETGKVQISPYLLYYIKRAYNRYINKRKVVVDRRVYIDITRSGRVYIIGELNIKHLHSKRHYWERRAYWGLFIHAIRYVAKAYLGLEVRGKLLTNVSVQQKYSPKRYKNFYKIQARLTTKEPIFPDSDYVFTINRESDWRLGTEGKYAFPLKKDYTHVPEEKILYYLQGGRQYSKGRPRKTYDKPRERVLQYPKLRKSKPQKLLNYIKANIRFYPKHVQKRIMQDILEDTLTENNDSD